MIKQCCKMMMRQVDNEGGFTMIAALMLLMLLTIIGVTAINTSTTGTMITSAEESKRTAFYVAESAVEQTIAPTAVLQTQFVEVNQKIIWSAMASGTSPLPQPRWNFALNGNDWIGNGHNHNVLATEAILPTVTSPKWMDRFTAGVLWFDNGVLGNDTYDVRVWNNATDPLPQTDTDGLIVVGAIAKGRQNTRAAVEVVLNGATGPGPVISGYAQAGAGSGKNFNAADVGAISFSDSGRMSVNANLW